MHLQIRSLTICAAMLAPLTLSGCHVSEHKNGKDKNVDIDVPFASMHVKTNNDAQVAGMGLTVYPGAVPVKEHNDKDNDAANIDMSFGDFHLGVKAATYQTSDSPAKVETFYRNDMKKYGDVIKCQGNTTVGQPTRTSQGLTCKDNDNKHDVNTGITVGKDGVHVNGSGSSDNPELRAGSPSHQHIVGIEPKDGGTKIGLVMLDLPKGDHSSEASE